MHIKITIVFHLCSRKISAFVELRAVLFCNFRSKNLNLIQCSWVVAVLVLMLKVLPKKLEPKQSNALDYEKCESNIMVSRSFIPNIPGSIYSLLALHIVFNKFMYVS